MARTKGRVVWGFSVTIDTFSPTRRFRSVDFPELGRPTIDTNPDLVMCFRRECLQPQALHTTPVSCEHFDFNPSMLNLFSGSRQSSKQFDDGSGHRRTIGIRHERHSELSLEQAKL